MNGVPFYLLMPLAAAIIYSAASMFLKKALTDGMSPIGCFHVNNWAGLLFFLPLAFFENKPMDWPHAYQPICLGVLFFVGGWFTFIAMTRGDVSLVTPVLGSKVVFVALGSALFIADRMPLLMWVSAVITTAGIFLMSATDLKTPRGGHLAGPVALALISAACFALCDVFVQRWAPPFGAKRFLVICTTTTGLLSLVSLLLPSRPRMAWNSAMRWTLGGSLLIAIQAMLIALALAQFGDALGVNVVYATRGLWILLIVAAFGPLIGNLERRESGTAFGVRIAAACLLLVGVVCAVMGRS